MGWSWRWKLLGHLYWWNWSIPAKIKLGSQCWIRNLWWIRSWRRRLWGTLGFNEWRKWLIQRKWRSRKFWWRNQWTINLCSFFRSISSFIFFIIWRSILWSLLARLFCCKLWSMVTKCYEYSAMDSSWKSNTTRLGKGNHSRKSRWRSMGDWI